MKLPFFRKIKPNKTTIVLGVAISIGLLAALAARNYLSNRMEAIEAQAHGKTVDLVVAKQDLDKGAKLSSDNVVIRKIPAEYAHAAAIEPGSFDRIDGEKLAYPIKAGQLIMWGLMETKRVPTFSTRVEVGHRAMTVPVDEISSISGMLEPGDVIDLIVTVEHAGKKATFPLLQSVQVMATGQRAVDDAKSGERREYSTVTLDTTPEQAQNVIMAREGGKITALLRNPQDKQKMGESAVDMLSMLNGRNTIVTNHGSTTSAGAAELTEVPVLYGGRTTKFTPEQLQMGVHQKADETLGSQILKGQAQTINSSATLPAAAALAAQQAQFLAGANNAKQ